MIKVFWLDRSTYLYDICIAEAMIITPGYRWLDQKGQRWLILTVYWRQSFKPADRHMGHLNRLKIIRTDPGATGGTRRRRNNKLSKNKTGLDVLW